MTRIFHYQWAGAIIIASIVLGWSDRAVADELATGRNLYNAKCQICHGANGRGDGPAASALNPKPRDFANPEFWQNNADEKIKRTVTTGKGMMPPFNLGDDEIKAITDYMAQTFKK